MTQLLTFYECQTLTLSNKVFDLNMEGRDTRSEEWCTQVYVAYFFYVFKFFSFCVFFI